MSSRVLLLYCHVISKQWEQINFGKPRTWKLKYCMATQRCWVIWTESHQKKNTFGMSQVEGGAPKLCWFSSHRPPDYGYFITINPARTRPMTQVSSSKPSNEAS